MAYNPDVVSKSIGDDKGDLIGFSADNTPVKIPKAASDGKVLKSLASATGGIEWGDGFTDPTTAAGDLLVRAYTSTLTPALVQTATADDDGDSVSVYTTRNLTPSWGSPTTVGNTLVAVVALSNSDDSAAAGSTITPPDGNWTLVNRFAKDATGGGDSAEVAIYIKLEAASESGSQTWVIGSTSDPWWTYIQVHEFSGVGGTVLASATASLDSTSLGATTYALGSMSHSQSGLAIIGHASTLTSDSAMSCDNSFTETADFYSTTVDINAAVYYKVLSGSGSVSPTVTSSVAMPGGGSGSAAAGITYGIILAAKADTGGGTTLTRLPKGTQGQKLTIDTTALAQMKWE